MATAKRFINTKFSWIPREISLFGLFTGLFFHALYTYVPGLLCILARITRI